MEDKRQPLGRGGRVEHDEEGKADRVGQQRLFLRLQLLVWTDDRVGYVHPDGFRTPVVA